MTGFVKAPVALVASSALSAVSLAVQPHVDIERASRLRGPCSLFFLTIADSGERKTTVDSYFTGPIREYVAAKEAEIKPDLVKYEADRDSWNAVREGILASIKESARKQKPTDVLRRDLAELDESKPTEPRFPRLLLGDETPESLAWTLCKKWPSAAVMSSEAGTVFGSHGMGRDSIMRNLAQLNVLWDGGELSIGRKTSESFTVRGARLTAHLQTQGSTIKSFVHRSDGLARGTGFLARFLISWPVSTQGFRLFTEAPASWPRLAAFNRRMREVLELSPPLDDDGTLKPTVLQLSKEAKTAWVRFHDQIEGELRSGGELFDVRDCAAKCADNAARLATLFELFAEDHPQNVSLESFGAASAIVAWHLSEGKRFFGELVVPEEDVLATKLDAWLGEYARREATILVPVSKVLQFGPAPLRKAAALNAAIEMLIEADRVQSLPGKPRMLAINPALLGAT